MSFRRRLMLIVVSAIACALLAVAGMAWRAAADVGDAIEQGRATYLIGIIRSAAETNLSFGLPLDQMPTIEALMEREKLSDPSILAIDVFYPEGRSVYSTDRGALGEPVPPDWTTSLYRPGLWQLSAHGELVLGSRIENELGTAAGGIAITLSDQPRETRDFALALDLSSLTFIVTLAGALLAAFTIRPLARLLTRPFANAAQALAEGSEAARHGKPHGALALAAQDVRERWQASEAAAAQAMHDLRALDDGA
jgi:hypothetical protein